ncbi:MAG: PTS sugar transporter subunit IIC [Solobacterium sp.]|nr:PTS sugar transporter subunit IIC [Solobacterium sp.]
MFTPLQVILLALLVAVWKWHMYNLQSFYYGSVVTVGVLTGLIMGDVKVGMVVGGTFCLMSLGLFGAGGSSVPDYQIGCIAGTAFAIAMGLSGEAATTTAMTIGIPVAALGTELDVLGKTSGSFFVHKMMDASEKQDWKGMGRWMWLSQIPFLGLWVLPIVLLTTVGYGAVETVIHAIPPWLNNGLTVASGMLPALGFAILLRQLPMKKYGYFILFGYALAAYAGLGVLAIAMLAVVACVFIYQLREEQDKKSIFAASAMGGDDEDE